MSMVLPNSGGSFRGTIYHIGNMLSCLRVRDLDSRISMDTRQSTEGGAWCHEHLGSYFEPAKRAGAEESIIREVLEMDVWSLLARKIPEVVRNIWS